MQPHNEQYLKDKYPHWAMLRDSQVVSNLGNDTREQYLRIYREEIDGRALYCLTCPEDVAKLVTNLYTWYDKYAAAKPKYEAAVKKVKK